jgi:hypothetical protein
MDIKEVISIIFSIIAVIGMVTTILYTQFGAMSKIKEDSAKAMADIRQDFNNKFEEIRSDQSKQMLDVKTDIMAIKTEHNIFWECVKDRIVDSLKNFPEQLDKDILLDKFKEDSLSVIEMEKLRTILCEEQKLTKENQFAYVMVITRLEQLIRRQRKVAVDGQGICDST